MKDNAMPIDLSALAMAHMQPAASLPEDAGVILLPLARSTIAMQLHLPAESVSDAAWLHTPGASFVTLMLDGKLRGCIGTLEPHRSLFEDVKANALAAAFRDPRFKPLTADEFASTRLEISVLSPVTPMQWRDEADALSQLRPGIDGLIFEYGHHRSTFLPQVWEEFADAKLFMGNLKYKGGLPPDFWDPAVKLSRYTVAKWQESK
jgi:AmmeMemoRadiSam system protein A